jgi:hypothetical protein
MTVPAPAVLPGSKPRAGLVWPGRRKRKMRLRELQQRGRAWAPWAEVCQLLELSDRLTTSSYLVHHADNETLLLNLVCLDGVLILQNFAWVAISI